MPIPNFNEEWISQVPALQMLVKLGYVYLPWEEAVQMRGERKQGVLLEEVLRKQLDKLNRIPSRDGEGVAFSPENIERAIGQLRDLPLQEGFMAACEAVYDKLVLGISLEQVVDGRKTSHDLRYIDWEHPHRNVFHVVEEYSVVRVASNETYRPDIVLFVNGIPFGVIECKSPLIDDPLRQAVSQHVRNQKEDGIPHLYAYAQLVMAIWDHGGSYATSGTPLKFWSVWREVFGSQVEEDAYRHNLELFKNTALSPKAKDLIFAERGWGARHHFDDLAKGYQHPAQQDALVYDLCRPERLLEMAYSFVLFDNGVKKIARYQQFFGIRKLMARAKHPENGRRMGGVLWHTQGSGKSLTMVMLARMIAREPSITDAKIVLVTDRLELDDQITHTFQQCGLQVSNAKSGQKLVDHLLNPKAEVVTTIINKFQNAVRNLKEPLTSPNIFVLVDEGHRTQHGIFHTSMLQALPNACFVAFTGTPLFKKEKSTAAKFGGIVDAYTVRQAVEDGAVLPLLYEGRHVEQDVNAQPLDNFFARICEPLTDAQKVDLKKKFARADQLNVTEQKMYAIAWDISLHFEAHWKDSPFKGQLVCDRKDSAIRYHLMLEEIGKVRSMVLISPPDDREGEEDVHMETHDNVRRFWKGMMTQYRTPEAYEKAVRQAFHRDDEIRLIIVVDKLLTGFDEPLNTYLYLTRNLQGHKLLQAIARVNRLYDGKDFGYVIDYYGVLGNLDEAMKVYSALEDFDAADIEGTLTDIQAEVDKLPQKHSALVDIFRHLPNALDTEAYQVHLGDEQIRHLFYDKLSAFAKALKLAKSSAAFMREVDPALLKRYDDDLKFYTNLRTAVMARYSDRIDYSAYEGQIQNLLHRHVTSGEVQVITQLVNIFDTESFEEELARLGTPAARADTILSRTAKHIAERMEEDPAFYQKFSDMLKQIIADYHAKRISEAEYLNRSREAMEAVLSRTDSSIPQELEGKELAKALFGLVTDALKSLIADNAQLNDVCTQAALVIHDLLQKALLHEGKPVVDWMKNSGITGPLQLAIEDYLIDEVRDAQQLQWDFDAIDKLSNKIMDLAKVRFR